MTTDTIGKVYQKEMVGGVTTYRKQYFFGAQMVAVRTDGTLKWVIGDHLGSSSVTASEDGSLYSEVKYREAPSRVRPTGRRGRAAGRWRRIIIIYPGTDRVSRTGQDLV